jgi:hypothetical protein
VCAWTHKYKNSRIQTRNCHVCIGIYVPYVLRRHRSAYFKAISLLHRPCVSSSQGMVGSSSILLEPTILAAPPSLGDRRKLGLAAVSSHQAPAANRWPPPACGTPERASPLTRALHPISRRQAGRRRRPRISRAQNNLSLPAPARLTPLSTRSSIKLAADPQGKKHKKNSRGSSCPRLLPSTSGRIAQAILLSSSSSFFLLPFTFVFYCQTRQTLGWTGLLRTNLL